MKEDTAIATTLAVLFAWCCACMVISIHALGPTGCLTGHDIDAHIQQHFQEETQ